MCLINSNLAIFMSFSRLLIDWYHENKRDLPFRKTRDPYKIWISEIILQQTRMEQGVPYYKRFIEKFPDVFSLANAKEEEVLKLWQGLGYYSRARNLLIAARMIAETGKGNFPEKFEEIIQLKGIGEYTASAIASIAFGLPYPVVDGNVYRVISRYFGIRVAIDTNKGKKQIREKLDAVFNRRDPSTFNQALMEFGALQCIPKNPVCKTCPFSNPRLKKLKPCYAFRNQIVKSLPRKEKKQKIKKRYFNYLIFRKKNKILIQKRTAKDIWQNLYDFPLLESKKILNKNKIPFKIDRKSTEFKQILSHQSITARFHFVSDQDSITGRKKENQLYVSIDQLHKYPFPKLILDFLKVQNL